MKSRRSGASEGTRTLETSPPVEFAYLLGNGTYLAGLDRGERCNFCCNSIYGISPTTN